MKQSNSIVLTLVASFALWGVFEGLAVANIKGDGKALPILHAVLISGLIFWWTSLDARSRNQRITPGWKAAIILFGMASLPFYLHKNRSADRKWISIAKGVGLFVTSCALYVSAYTLIAPAA